MNVLPACARWCAAVTIGCMLTVASTLTAQTSIALPGDRVFPENITSSHDGTIYIGSLATGGVLRVRPNSDVAESWIKPGTFGSGSVFGVLADDRTNLLWACSNNLSARGLVVEGQAAGSELKAFDLKSGEGKISVALPGTPMTCNDIAIGPDGSAYVTNTAAPQILRLQKGSDHFDIWMTDSTLQPSKGAGIDGIAFGSDGNLYFDTYGSGGLYRIDVKDGKAGMLTKLKPTRPVALTDGLRAIGKHQFIIVEGEGRVDRMTIKGDSAIIETLGEGYIVPTGATLVGKTVWVSEGQLRSMFDPEKKGIKPSLPFRIISAPLVTH